MMSNGDQHFDTAGMRARADSDIARPHQLRELTAGLIEAPAEIVVRDVTLDSRAVSPGALFLACSGRHQHGLRFAGDAVARGARAVLFEERGASEADSAERQLAATLRADIFVAGVPQLSRHVGLIADRFFDSPSATLTIAAITGTNGKTTCAWLLAQALQQTRCAAYMGTLGFGIPPALTATEHTTGDAVRTQRQLAMLRGQGADCVCMEVSSHAIDQERIGGVRFHTAAFTNLTRDHLDYHGTMAAYGAAKARLFDSAGLVNRVINVDDAFGAQLAARPSPSRLVVTSRRIDAAGGAGFPDAEYVRAHSVTTRRDGFSIGIASSWGETQLEVPLIGEFNIDNVLTVLAVLLSWKLPLSTAAAVLARCHAPSGRMEVFGGKAGAATAIVDYAHTPDALAKALRAARTHCRGKLRVVFGCGGDRDAGKRPLMGRVAAELADEVIVTDDNPRTEDPARIVADILAGMCDAHVAHVEHDRATAIRAAMQAAGPDDVVLIAGKGHEDYQIHGTLRRFFRDQDVVAAELRRTRS